MQPISANIRNITVTAIAGVMAATSGAWAQSHELKEYLDLAYYDGADADEERHKLNLIIPETDEPAPLLLWIPSGAWSLGSRGQQTPVARHFAKAGIATAAMDHRMSPALNGEGPYDGPAKHPDHVVDSARAAAWLLENGADYGVDTDNFFIGGYSSGAHLAALMVMDPQYLNDVGVELSRVRAALPVAGAYDMERYRDAIFENLEEATAMRHIFGVFGTDDTVLKPASPNHYLSSATIPMLVVSEADTYNYTVWFEEEVEAADMGDLIRFVHHQDQTHRSLFVGMRDEDEFTQRDQMVDYLMEFVQ